MIKILMILGMIGAFLKLVLKHVIMPICVVLACVLFAIAILGCLL